MKTTVVTFRFCFRTYKPTAVSLLWTLVDPSCHNPESANFFEDSNNINTLNLLESLQDSQETSCDYINDLTITTECSKRLYFKFRFAENKYSHTGNYLIFKSLQDPVIISDFERNFSNLNSQNDQNNQTIEITENKSDSFTLRFKINYQTYYGQILYIVGSLPELGYWDINRGLRLFHSGTVSKNTQNLGLFTDNRFNWQCDVTLSGLPGTLAYKYVVVNETSEPFAEPGNIRYLCFSQHFHNSFVEFNDVWRWNEPAQSLFSKRLFDETLFVRKNVGYPLIDCHPVQNSQPIKQSSSLNIKSNLNNSFNHYNSMNNSSSTSISCDSLYRNDSTLDDDKSYVICLFCAHCGVVGRARRLFVVGSIPELGQWNPSKGAELKPSADLQWSTTVFIPRNKFPFEFKFVAVGGADAVVWETHENRSATLSDSQQPIPIETIVSIDSWHLSFANLCFHGSGVCLDMNFLSTSDFGLINKIAEWSQKVGFAAIHFTGLLDTTGMTNTFNKLPLSGFALNPVLADLSEFSFVLKPPNTRENIIFQKINFMRDLWLSNRSRYIQHVEKFRNDNLYWIEDYERLCYEIHISQQNLNKQIFIEHNREEYCKVVDFVQFLLYLQLTRANKYARDLNVAVGTDIVFAVSDKSAEALYKSSLFLTQYHLGFPPTVFNPIGVVLEAYPYNFSNAEQWFRSRIAHFSQFFSILRLESTIRFFRQWVVPRKTSVLAISGHFEPSVSISFAELETWGLWDIERYVQPYIRPQLLQKLFGNEDAMKIQSTFLEHGADSSIYFKEQFNHEKKLVSAQLDQNGEELRKKYLPQLLRLLNEVLLVKVSDNEYRPRPLIKLAAISSTSLQDSQPLNLNSNELYNNIVHNHNTNNIENTKNSGNNSTGGVELSFSFSELPLYHQSPFVRLEDEFVNNKQKCLWSFTGRQVLQRLTSANDATFFSDAAGIEGDICDEALQAVGVLPLRVQMEGRSKIQAFDDIRGYPYLSVASPQRDLSVPMRVVWEDSRKEASRLWIEEFWESGAPPETYEDSVAENIMKQHCWCASMWVLFPIDALVGAGNHIVSSDHSKFGVLDVEAFFDDERARARISHVLEQTKRK
ncbi:Starch binding domain containing protein [Tritrichomonas foetus]|uniref:4-alpha-glucanotransferase n=1 Tax=Tritrichomonas foetus TaxID=1144522 RepID=A0A1J4KLE6_9EUKA|nr:Starch binding domain containing protein [Tritrichomonas foetus]|eukprot:OHT10510.1 Starch binding domain containing protein [Tritrichomonas foetus]